MKLTSLLSYAAASALAAFIVSLMTPQDIAVSFALLAVSTALLILAHDYTPRSYFVVTPGPSLRKPSFKRVPLAPGEFHSLHGRSTKQTVAHLA